MNRQSRVKKKMELLNAMQQILIKVFNRFSLNLFKS